jgi:excisionase family DNA binding protein
MRTQSVTAREAAQMLRVNLAFVYQLCWSGKLQGARKDGKTWLIPIEAIQKRIQATTAGVQR